MRGLIDFLAILLAWVFVAWHTGSNLLGAVAGLLAGGYGVWCFYDGLHATHPTKDTKQ